jgi:hypothetical protein
VQVYSVAEILSRNDAVGKEMIAPRMSHKSKAALQERGNGSKIKPVSGYPANRR